VRHRRWIAPFLALLAALSSAAFAAPTGNVDLFEKSLQAATEASRVYGSWDAPAERRRVAEIGYRVAQETGYRDFPISFYLIDLAEPNAFALPGGQVFVTRGMLALGLSDDELAALLGHEIAHVVNRHGTKIERRATLLNVLAQAAVIGVMLNADRSHDVDPRLPYPYNLENRSSAGDLITGTYATGLILSELLLRSYSRDFEDEADRDGQRWAAAAGYSRLGTQDLMEVLGTRLPDSKEYGYWRTHPFFDQRVQIAEIRARSLVEGEAKPTEEFRSWSQRQILEYGAVAARDKPPAERMIESAALTAWPGGVESERLRLAQLHRLRQQVEERLPISRDYGSVLTAYDRELEDVAGLSPSESFVSTLRSERTELASAASELLPRALEVLAGGVYETGFLETFRSNWPDVEEAPRVSLALGEAYSRTGRQADAVEMFLEAEGATDEAITAKAQRALATLAPRLDQLTALAQLAAQDRNPELADVAGERLAAIVGTYDKIEYGAAYLERFPDGEHVLAVNQRLNELAANLYGEVLLYQGVGDHLKAIDRMQQILTYAPASPAAGKLLERVVLPG